MAITPARLLSLFGFVRDGRAADSRRERTGASDALRPRSGRGEPESNHAARAQGPDLAGAAPRLKNQWRAIVRARLLVCAVLLGVWTTGIEARLVYLQVFNHAELMARADRQQLRTVAPPAKRGEIFDRNGRVLAYSVDADTIAAIPTDIDNPAEVAAQVCQALDECGPDRRQTITKSLSRRAPFAYVARQASPEEAKRVRALALPGITLLKESRRYYPNSELAAHVIGYVGIENAGLGGIESAYDSQIRGKDGKILIQTDAKRHALFSRVERAATAGAGIELTIDQYLQYVAERELREGVETNRAAGGSAIVMDPHTGEILALANWPTFNPNAFGKTDNDARRNRAIQDIYEPGSTFKIVTASAAIQEHVMTPDTPIDTSPGYITFGRRVIHDDHAGLGTIPFTDVIVKSSNVGAIKIGMRVGPERLGEYMARFGFGQTLAPDFRGESPGIVWSPARLDPSALASVSMGYQVGVTPLQMVTAASTVANGGNLLEPRVVRAFVRDGKRIDVPHKTLRRAIDTDTAATLSTIMEQVVERGTGKAARMEGYTIAGKTGTAHKLVNGRYSNADYNASFVGFVPSRNPALAIIVVIDSPHGPNSYYGGTVSAPIFKRIAEAAVTYLGIAPNLNPVPPVLVARHDESADPDTAPQPRTASVLAATLEPARNGLMPDLRGLSAREALRLLSRIGMMARMSGDGFVVEQTPEPGAALVRGDACALTLGRRAPAVPGNPQ
ncbi:MAG TPA: penicillin-binding protein [Vicinamibacterales bacterium]|nr:penicillin-binding protein [Vicinamibacterales bacterium]